MISLIVFLLCLLLALGMGVLASISDYRGMIIPNTYSAIIIAAFAVAFTVMWLAGQDHVFRSLSSHLLGFGIVLFVTIVLFALKAIGGGDSKLLAAYGLWTGLQGLIIFLFYMSLAGGALGLAALALKKWKPVKEPRPGSWIALVQAGENKVPYGIAIFIGALAYFIKMGYYDVAFMAQFVQS